MKNIIQKLQNFIDYLLSNKTIEKNEDKTTSKVTNSPDFFIDNQIKSIYVNKGINIGDNYRYFFAISDISSCWSYTNKYNEFIYGGCCFNGLSEALAQRSEFWDVFNSLNCHDPSEEELVFLKKLNWFEKQSRGDGDGKFGCFLREPGEFPPKIYFYDSGAYFPMNTTLEEYFDAMIDSCAVRGWQYFYIDFPDTFPELREVNKEKILVELVRTVTVLPKLFPDKYFSYHQERFKEIEKKLKN